MTTRHSLTTAGLLVAAACVAAADYLAEVYLACAQIRPSDAALLREAATETDARGSDTLQSGPMRGSSAEASWSTRFEPPAGQTA
jgi:hypothetical protein